MWVCVGRTGCTGLEWLGCCTCPLMSTRDFCLSCCGVTAAAVHDDKQSLRTDQGLLSSSDHPVLFLAHVVLCRAVSCWGAGCCCCLLCRDDPASCTAAGLLAPEHDTLLGHYHLTFLTLHCVCHGLSLAMLLSVALSRSSGSTLLWQLSQLQPCPAVPQPPPGSYELQLLRVPRPVQLPSPRFKVGSYIFWHYTAGHLCIVLMV